VAIVLRLVQLQVRDAPEYRALALEQRTREIELPATRGSIFDRDGQALAMSVPAKAVYASPSEVLHPGQEAQAVATALGIDEDVVLAKLKGTESFVYLARGVDPQRAAALAAQKLPGIGFLSESRRSYPGQSLAAHVLGFVGLDGYGLAGLEQQYETLLAGRAGHEVVEADPSGVLIPQAGGVEVAPVAGDDLILTLDRQIQFQAETALAAAVKANHARGGSVIVLVPGTGDILAMADYPTFDPNKVRADDVSVLRNRTVTDPYEPGSVNKVVTAAAALEEGRIDVKERLTVPYSYQLYTKTFHDAHFHLTEKMTLGDILAYSSNIGTIEIAHRLGPDLLYEYLQRFGLTGKTGLGFPGESRGLLPTPDHWSGTSIGAIPIGQEIAVTPLQMAAVYATIANRGVWVQPRLVQATVGPDGQVHQAAASPTHRVISEETASTLTDMLAWAVDVGTGTRAQVPGYWTAGKTGTARKVDPDGSGYITGKYIASFIGFAPALHPAIVVAVALDEPVNEYGGLAAAPLFKSVAEFALARLRVPLDEQPAPPPHVIPTQS
jgi:cell division protein FtsI (penicillin-binding protein 3)